jgi:hypothetical protein
VREDIATVEMGWRGRLIVSDGERTRRRRDFKKSVFREVDAEGTWVGFDTCSLYFYGSDELGLKEGTVAICMQIAVRNHRRDIAPYVAWGLSLGV